MGIRLHWFLPTGGDSRDVLAVGDDAHRREPTLDYLSVLARTAEDLGFGAVLTPTRSRVRAPASSPSRSSRSP